MSVLTGSYSISNISLLPKLVAEMFLRFHSMLWLSDSYDDTTLPTLAFSIFKGFCFNFSVFPHFFYTKFSSQLFKVKHFQVCPLLGCDVSELFEVISECERCDVSSIFIVF